MFYVSKKLISSGHQVHVVSLKKFLLFRTGETISIPASHMEITSRLANSLLASRGIDKTSSVNKVAGRGRALLRLKSNRLIRSIVRGIDRALYNEPGFLSGFIANTWVNELERKTNFHDLVAKHDRILISGPPFGLFRLVNHLKTHFPDTPVVLDYRDPWNLWKPNNFLTTLQEKKYLKLSDHVVCATNAVKKGLEKEYRIPAGKVSVIPNGVSPQIFSNSPRKFTAVTPSQGPATICYAGAITLNREQGRSYRSFEPIYDILRCYEKEVKFKVVGVTNLGSEYAEQLKARFSNQIELIGELPPLEAFEHLKNSDILYLPHTTLDNSAKYIISGKFYDYLAARRPILSVGAKCSLHSKLVSEYGVGYNSSLDKRELRLAFKKILESYEILLANCFALKPDRFDRDRINAKYVKLLESSSWNTG